MPRPAAPAAIHSLDPALARALLASASSGSYLAETHSLLGNREDARVWAQRALDIPHSGAADALTCRKTAAKILK